jgi:hypothetical protein
MSKSAWAVEASNILKGTIKRSGITYEQLAERLLRNGISETVPSIKNKLARGTFSFVFVLQVLKALDRDRLDIS